MKCFVRPFAVGAVALGLAVPALLVAQPMPVPVPPPKVVVPPPKPRIVRTPVVVHRDWPLKRPHRAVFVRPPRVVVRVPTARFVPPVVFKPVVIPARRLPVHDRLVWEDNETLLRDEEWTEFTLDCNSAGRKLWFEVRDGRVRIDWAEVVFESGDSQVVDFRDKSIGPGLYSLLDFQDGRRVDHVRFVAQARSRQVKLILRMEK